MRENILVVLALLAGGFTLLSLQRPSILQSIKVDDVSFRAEIADTALTREKGLSHKLALSPDSAMLFVFEQPDDHCFWMKDMRFAIDILWFDEGKQLIYQEQNVQPDSYPTNYCPPSAAKYVVEINAGTSAKFGWKTGDNLSF